MSLVSDVIFILIDVVVALAWGAFGAFLVSCYAHKLGLLDKPSERSSHVKVTPKGGGIGLLATLLTATFFVHLPFWLWIPCATVSIISLFGDRVHLSQVLRLCIQFICAISVLAGLYHAGQFRSLSEWWLVLPLCAVLAVYIVGTANFYNFMDGINGIAGLTGALAFGGLAFFAHVHNLDERLVILHLSIAVACVGFLPFNYPKARVFMGDVGSILLGFLFATSVVALSNSVADFVCLSSFLFPFYADEVATMLVRIRARENLLQAHRRHVYQILVNQMGMAHWKVSLLYCVMQFFVGGITFALRPFGTGVSVAWLLSAFVIFALAGAYVRRREYPATGSRGPALKPSEVSNPHPVEVGPSR